MGELKEEIRELEDEIDQREIQRLGGKAAECPSSYVVVTMLERNNLFNRVLDVTYGEGRFYCYRKPKLLVGADPYVQEWTVKPDMFIPRPVWSLFSILKDVNIGFDVLVCDPPQWNEGVCYHKRKVYSLVVGDAKLIINESIKLAKQLGIEHMLLHWNKVLDLPIVENKRFLYFARYLHNEGKNTTYFTIYKVEGG